MILRSEIVERAKAGDKCVFTGTFIVVPDVAALGLPGVNAEMLRESAGGRTGGGAANMGVGGLKALGVKDLTYKTAFLACMATSAEARVSLRSAHFSPHSGTDSTFIPQSSATNIRSDPAESGGAGASEQDSREEFLQSLTREEIQQLQSMVAADHIYARLVSSIAPTVYGQFSPSRHRLRRRRQEPEDGG